MSTWLTWLILSTFGYFNKIAKHTLKILDWRLRICLLVFDLILDTRKFTVKENNKLCQNYYKCYLYYKYFHHICNFIKITLRHEYSPVNLLPTFRTPFAKNTFGRLLLKLKNTRTMSYFFIFYDYMKTIEFSSRKPLLYWDQFFGTSELVNVKM